MHKNVVIPKELMEEQVRSFKYDALTISHVICDTNWDCKYCLLSDTGVDCSDEQLRMKKLVEIMPHCFTEEEKFNILL